MVRKTHKKIILVDTAWKNEERKVLLFYVKYTLTNAY